MLSFESCNCRQVFLSLNPPTTAWPQRHDEDEDFLALVRHNAAVQLETDRWPALKKRRVVKPTVDEQYIQALCNWGGHARGTAAPLAGMRQQDDRGPLGGMAAACLPTLALDARRLRRRLDDNKKERRRTARCSRSDHSHSSRETVTVLARQTRHDNADSAINGSAISHAEKVSRRVSCSQQTSRSSSL